MKHSTSSYRSVRLTTRCSVRAVSKKLPSILLLWKPTPTWKGRHSINCAYV